MRIVILASLVMCTGGVCVGQPGGPGGPPLEGGGTSSISLPSVEVTSVSLTAASAGNGAYTLSAEAGFSAAVPAGYPAWDFTSGVSVTDYDYYDSQGTSGSSIASFSGSSFTLTPTAEEDVSYVWTLSNEGNESTVCAAGDFYIGAYVEGQPSAGGGTPESDFDFAFLFMEE